MTLSAFISIDCLEVKVILLACFEISFAAGKYLVIKTRLWCLRIVYIKFSILHLSTLYKTIYRGFSFKGALHVTEISSPSKRLSRHLV